MWNADASNGPRASWDTSTVSTKRDGAQPSQAWCRTSLEAGETSVQLQSTNAQTASKTEEYQRPESTTIQQLAEPDEVYETTPQGRNPLPDASIELDASVDDYVGYMETDDAGRSLLSRVNRPVRMAVYRPGYQSAWRPLPGTADIVLDIELRQNETLVLVRAAALCF